MNKKPHGMSKDDFESLAPRVAYKLTGPEIKRMAEQIKESELARFWDFVSDREFHKAADVLYEVNSRLKKNRPQIKAEPTAT